jgi:hypothetical protein
VETGDENMREGMTPKKKQKKRGIKTASFFTVTAVKTSNLTREV